MRYIYDNDNKVQHLAQFAEPLTGLLQGKVCLAERETTCKWKENRAKVKCRNCEQCE